MIAREERQVLWLEPAPSEIRSGKYGAKPQVVVWKNAVERGAVTAPVVVIVVIVAVVKEFCCPVKVKAVAVGLATKVGRFEFVRERREIAKERGDVGLNAKAGDTRWMCTRGRRPERPFKGKQYRGQKDGVGALSCQSEASRNQTVASGQSIPSSPRGRRESECVPLAMATDVRRRVRSAGGVEGR